MFEPTLYPKICGKPNDLISRLDKLGLSPGRFELIGTVKLHGTHADIVVDNEDNIRLQSRHTLVDVRNDIYGYAAFMLPLRHEILELKRQYLARYAELNPGNTIDPQHPLVIAGEWIGNTIQKGVALTQLSKRFVIISVSINNTWLPDEDYADIHNESADIYNISRGGFYYQNLVLDSPQAETKLQQESSFSAMRSQTEAIDKLCPFAATFGIAGVGEGIVWKIRESPYNANPELWLKTKGHAHRERPLKSTAAHRSAKDTSDRAPVAEFAEQVVTERRLEQGFEYLREMGLRPDKKNKATYVRWLQNDVLVEEQTEIEAVEISKVELKSEIARIAKNHYFEYMVDGDEKGS